MPRDNLLVPKTGDGLTIAYHGLNLAGWLRATSAAARVPRDLLPWISFRRTYGQPIQVRELVKRVSPGWRR